jgi:CBS domain-containing protein
VTAADAMTPGPLTVTPRTSVAAALRLRALVPRAPEAVA